MSIPRRVTRLNAAAVTAAPARLTPAGQRHEHVCDGKSQYRSKAKAKEYAAIMTKRHGTEMFPYECPACSQWHLTTMRPEEYRARLREGAGR